MKPPSRIRLLSCLVFAAFPTLLLADVKVSNVRAAQREGTKLVDILYDLDGNSQSFTVSLRISNDDGVTFTVPAENLSGAFGAGIEQGNDHKITWNAGLDWNGRNSPKMRFEVTASDTPTSSGKWIAVPAGSFTMGDAFAEGQSNEVPTHSVITPGILMMKQEVTFGEWKSVRNWALENGYTFSNPGEGKAANHPVQTVSWHDAVKWCNAKSEMDSRTPCYRAGGNVYRNGESTPTCNWSANGYRLPTEAEWEKAARGGTIGKRFPWGNTINHKAANYVNGKLSYESPQGGGYHPIYATGGFPYTSPAGSFAANAYGFDDMAGNVWEWCWDWYGQTYYADPASGNHPKGPPSGTLRVIRGGGWSNPANQQRVSSRYANNPTNRFGYIGFRIVRGD